MIRHDTRRTLWLLVASLVAGAGVWAYLLVPGGGSTRQYRTARVERGPLTAIVSASGTLNAVVTVQVGSQVSGQIKELLADFNTVVRKGQVIARLDADTLEARAGQARAEVEAAQASEMSQEAQVERARSDVENARAALAEARAQTERAQVGILETRRDLDRKRELLRRELISRSEWDTAESTYDTAVTQHQAARAKERALAAAIRSAEAQQRVTEALFKAAGAQVKQKRAALQQAMVDLKHTAIRAPVDGIVVARSVDVGQTVAASLQAPTLFTIARDLTSMQVETSILEADIGRIRLGDRAAFTIDAFPGDTFRGKVSQIRKAAQIVQNVVTYTVVVEVDNRGGKLLPGMTANVRVGVDEKASVLRVANAALRFRPVSAGDGGPAVPPPAATGAGRRTRPDGLPGRAWIVGADGEPKPVALSLGISDGRATEVLAGDLTEGQEVIVGLQGTPTVPGRPAGRQPRLKL